MLMFICFLFCLIACFSQTIINPVFDRTDTPAFRVEKVELTNDTTYVYCSYSADANSWANISGETYLTGYPSGKKYKMLSNSGLPLAPETKNFIYDEKCEVLLCFPSIKGSNHFDLIENPDEKAFNIYGISLKKQFEKQFSISELRRSSNMSSFYDSANDTIKAIQFKKNETESTKYIHGIKSEAFLVSLLGLAIMYDKYEYYREALDLMEAVTAMHAEIWGTSDSNYALQLRTHAQFFSHAGIFDKAIKTYKESISKYESLNDYNNEYALALRFISDDYQLSGDEKHAIEYQSKAIEVRKKIGNSEGYLEELENMLIQGDSIARTNIVDKELSNLPEFVDTTSTVFSIVLKTLTSSLINAQNYSTAMKYCEKNLSLLYKNEESNTLEIAEALGNKCRINRRLDLFHEAIAIGEKAKGIFDSINAHPQIYCFILEDLAWCYGALYDYENAIIYQKQLAAIYEESQDWISLAGALGTIGEYYKYKESLNEAEEHIRKALDIISKHNAEEIINEELRKGTIGLSHYSNHLKNVTNYYQIVKNSILHSLANVCFKSGKYSEAIQVQIESNRNAIEMRDNEMYLSGLGLLSLYYQYNRQYEESICAQEEAISLIKQSDYYKSDKRSLSVTLSGAYLQIAHNYYRQKDYQQAINSLLQSISFSEGSNNIDAHTLPKIILSIIYYENKEYDKAESYLSETLDFLQSAITSEITQMKTEQKQRIWDKYEYAFVKYREIVEKGERNGGLYSKLYNYTLFSKNILLDSESSNDIITNSRIAINWKDIQKILSDQDIAIEFISTAEDSLYNTYHALVIDKTCNYPKMITLYHETDYVRIKQSSTKLVLDVVGDLIWKPILSQYPQIKNIYFSPEGILHRLPIEYSKVEGIGEMMEQYNLYRLSSTKEILFHKEKEANKNAILYGGLDYDMLAKESSNNTNEIDYSLLRSINARGGFDPLLSTLEEVNEIGNLLNNKNVLATLYTGVDGTEDSFKNLSGKDVNILHLSTHGMYVGPSVLEQKKKELNFDFMELITNEKDPVREDLVLTHSFLVMSGGNKLIRREAHGNGMNDGILTASEISHIDLSNVDLVVLSACETGLGDVENSGVYGLQRGFKKAGANTLLMSLDKVDDEATKILMVEFYKNLMNGKSKHQSLKDAQKYLRQVDNGKYDKPEYWASFIMLDGLN